MPTDYPQPRPFRRPTPSPAAVEAQIGSWAAAHGARYHSCRARADGTHEFCWFLPDRRRRAGLWRRVSTVLFRTVAGTPDSWDLVYEESDVSFDRSAVRYYAPLNARSDLAGLCAATEALVTAGREYRPRLTAKSGVPPSSGVIPLATMALLMFMNGIFRLTGDYSARYYVLIVLALVFVLWLMALTLRAIVHSP